MPDEVREEIWKLIVKLDGTVKRGIALSAPQKDELRHRLAAVAERLGATDDARGLRGLLTDLRLATGPYLSEAAGQMKAPPPPVPELTPKFELKNEYIGKELIRIVNALDTEDAAKPSPKR